MARSAVFDKVHVKGLVVVMKIALFGGSRQLILAHREKIENGIRYFPRILFVKNKQRRGLHSDIAVIGKSERNGMLIAKNQVVIPLLDSELRRLDSLAVIDLNQAARPAGLCKRSVTV